MCDRMVRATAMASTPSACPIFGAEEYKNKSTHKSSQRHWADKNKGWGYQSKRLSFSGVEDTRRRPRARAVKDIGGTTIRADGIICDPWVRAIWPGHPDEALVLVRVRGIQEEHAKSSRRHRTIGVARFGQKYC